MWSWLKRPSTCGLIVGSLVIGAVMGILPMLKVSNFWCLLFAGTSNFNLGVWYCTRRAQEREEERILKEAQDLLARAEEERLASEPPPATCGVLCKVIPFRRKMRP